MAFKIKQMLSFWMVFFICAFIEGKEKNFTLYDFISFSSESSFPDSHLEKIDQIYVINLDIRYERWLNTKKQLESFGVAFQRFSAINGWQLNRGKLKQLYKSCVINGCSSYLTPGQMGCFLSHLSILYDAFIKQHSCIWVLEDDILVLHNILELSQIVAHLDKFDPDWDLLFTDINARGNSFEEIFAFDEILGQRFNYSLVCDQLFTPQEDELVKRIEYRLCTHSMIISKRGIKKLLDYFQSIKIALPIDIQMHCCPNKRFYVCKKEYVTNGKREDSDTNCRPHR